MRGLTALAGARPAVGLFGRSRFHAAPDRPAVEALRRAGGRGALTAPPDPDWWAIFRDHV